MAAAERGGGSYTAERRNHSRDTHGGSAEADGTNPGMRQQPHRRKAPRGHKPGGVVAATAAAAAA